VATTKIILQGGGEHARVVLDALLSDEKNVVALFDPKYTGYLMGVPQLGNYNPDFEKEATVVIAIGDNALRKKVVSLTTHDFNKVIHSSVIISKTVTVEEGSQLLQGAIIQAQSKIGRHVIINTGSQVDHDCVIGDYVHLAPGVVLCGTVEIGEGTLIGAGATILPGKKIGQWATVGAGAVVIEDIPDYAVVVGCPAKIIKHNRP
jgi:sugar O-acyltransferase (sialic acid O-acetyltransferase NeuD family)